MIKVGTTIRVIEPNYAAGLLGTIECHEGDSGRWIIKLEESPLSNNKDAPWRLSLPESDFEVIERKTRSIYK